MCLTLCAEQSEFQERGDQSREMVKDREGGRQKTAPYVPSRVVQRCSFDEWSLPSARIVGPDHH